MKLKGHNLILTVSGSVIAFSKTCELIVDLDLVETSSPTTGTWKTFIAGMLGWKVTTSGLLERLQDSGNNGQTLFDLMKARQPISINVTERGTTNKYSGTAFITSLRQVATVKQYAQYTVELTGTGPLA